MVSLSGLRVTVRVTVRLIEERPPSTMFLDSSTMPERTVERQAQDSRAVGSQTLAPVLGATHDGRATVESARGLLITVLGEFVRPHDGAWTQTLIELMESLGVQSKATRQSLARLADSGWLERTKVGRRTRWHLTDTSRELLESGAERIYGFGQTPRSWDGRWSVILASLPDSHQASRHRLRTRLGWAGYASFEQGTWISPWTDHEDDAVHVLDDLGLDMATSFVAELGQLGSGADIVSRAWKLDVVSAEYQAFIDTTTRSNEAAGGAATGADAARRLTLLVHRWRRFPFLDPELPADLLPANWPGTPAARLFASTRAELAGPAQAWWLASEERFRT